MVLVTVMSTGVVEAVPAGDTMVNDVSEVTWRLVPGVPPKLTEVAVVNPVPVTVIVVPPEAGPAPGATALTVGAAPTVTEPLAELVAVQEMSTAVTV